MSTIGARTAAGPGPLDRAEAATPIAIVATMLATCDDALPSRMAPTGTAPVKMRPGADRSGARRPGQAGASPSAWTRARKAANRVGFMAGPMNEIERRMRSRVAWSTGVSS